MKRVVFLLIFVLFSSLARARNVDLIIGYNHLIEDKNITLIRLVEDKALICVNGVVGLVNEDFSRNVNGVTVDLVRIKGNIASFDFNYKCKGDCVCGKDCDNSVCFGNVEEPEVVEEVDKDEAIFEEETLIEKEEIVKSEGISAGSVIVAVLVTLVLLLGVIVLWKRI